MKIRLWPYKMGSAGAKTLSDALCAEGIDALRVRTDGRYRPRVNHLIINWGNSGSAGWFQYTRQDIPPSSQFLNKPVVVGTAANKLETFRILNDAGVTVPVFNTSKGVCDGLLRTNPALTIYCRTKLTGHSGAGIVVARTVEELVDAPLYTVGIQVRGEYRVHVFRSPTGEYKIIDVQKKRRRNEAVESGNVNMDVRNLLGGWVYAHNNVELEDTALEQAKRAVQALGLDFGAVDIIVEKNTNTPYVLEVNTAPGISSPQTIAKYVSAIKEYL